MRAIAVQAFRGQASSGWIIHTLGSHDVGIAVDAERSQAVGKHVSARFGEREVGPRLPLADGPGDAQRVGQGRGNARAEAFAQTHPRIDQLAVLAAPGYSALDRRKRIALLS
jgi:hypothetical protein